MAVVDEDGFMTIVDRLKDMIISGGHNVYSVEVENALAGHPDIADLAIIGQPHETFGETVTAVVTPVEGHEVTLESIRTFASERLTYYKVPRALIVAEIPRNPSGKILKHVLRTSVPSAAQAQQKS